MLAGSPKSTTVLTLTIFEVLEHQHFGSFSFSVDLLGRIWISLRLALSVVCLNLHILRFALNVDCCYLDYLLFVGGFELPW